MNTLVTQHYRAGPHLADGVAMPFACYISGLAGRLPRGADAQDEDRPRLVAPLVCLDVLRLEYSLTYRLTLLILIGAPRA